MRRSSISALARPSRLHWYVLATCVVGAPVAAGAAAAAAMSHPSPRSMLGIAMFFCFAMLAEWRPVPIDPAGRRLVSLAFVFIISSQLLFGWEWAVLTGTAAIGLCMAFARAEPLKVAFNSATYAIATGLAALPQVVTGHVGEHSYGSLAGSVLASGAIFVVVNVMLVCIAISLSSGSSTLRVFKDHLRYSGPIFGIMIFVAVQAVIFWRLSAPLVILLSAPIFALTLYQRSSVGQRVAEEAATTDSLTGLRNRRAFEDAAGALAAAQSDGGFALCLIDIDHFKHVNDRHGHMTGDAVLAAVAEAIEQAAPGQGYRLGGDEFALLLRQSADDAAATAAALQTLFAAAHGKLVPEAVTLSAGIALFPDHADELHSLKKRADIALYQSKYNGRARSTLYVADAQESESAEAFGFDLALIDNRLVTAHRLASLVDALSDASAMEQGRLAPTTYTDVLDRWRSVDGNHSQAVADLTVALARRLGVEGKELDNIWLAALLHDVGKIAVPDSILSKPGPLTDIERALVERHAIIGFELLRDMGLSPVDTYVLHHHEQWAGTGYPYRLVGPEIPFGSRLIHVADAFHALTSDRAYRQAVSVEAAMHELQGESGRQFDPLVVSALHEHLAHPLTRTERRTALVPAWSS